MPRLPVPGSDDGTWGDLLNEFLGVSHAGDGTLKANSVYLGALQANSVSNTKLQDGAVTANKLDTSSAPASNQVLSYNGSGLAWTTQSAAPVSSVAGKTGAVSLISSDVGLGNVDNTADADKPVSAATQTALNSKISSSEKGAANGVAALDGDGNLTVSPAGDAPASVTINGGGGLGGALYLKDGSNTASLKTGFGGGLLFEASGNASNPGVRFRGARANVLISDVVADRVPLAVKGNTGQTADLQQWQDVNSNVVAKITPAGALAVSGKISNVTDPTDTKDAATKNYVDTNTAAKADKTQAIARVVHNGSSYPARPSGYAYVEYIGPDQPTDWINGDTWIDTTP